MNMPRPSILETAAKRGQPPEESHLEYDAWEDISNDLPLELIQDIDTDTLVSNLGALTQIWTEDGLKGACRLTIEEYIKQHLVDDPACSAEQMMCILSKCIPAERREANERESNGAKRKKEERGEQRK